MSQLTPENVVAETRKKMEGGIEHYKKHLSSLRTGKASTSLVQDITVHAYGSTMKMNAVGNINTPDTRTITISPYDPSTINDIMKAIQASGIGINPMSDGKIIRLHLPELSEERRKDMVKILKAKGEEYKVEMRNLRREANEAVKKFEKDLAMSQDEAKRLNDQIQKLTDGKIEELTKLAVDKEKELLTV